MKKTFKSVVSVILIVLTICFTSLNAFAYRFEPESYTVGARISTASSALLILLVLLSAAGAVAFGKNTDKT